MAGSRGAGATLIGLKMDAQSTHTQPVKRAVVMVGQSTRAPRSSWPARVAPDATFSWTITAASTNVLQRQRRSSA